MGDGDDTLGQKKSVQKLPGGERCHPLANIKVAGGIGKVKAYLASPTPES